MEMFSLDQSQSEDLKKMLEFLEDFLNEKWSSGLLESGLINEKLRCQAMEEI